ncbi:MAG: ice-binding family protein, partial [Dehalococcoidia bacterium]|nr:ice-binding family protein [Dehalococcoidia bacterium]
MKNLMVRTNTFTRFTAKLAVIVLFAALLTVVPFQAALAATAPNLGTAGSFAVLGGPAVTLTNSAVAGDVGSGFPVPGSAVTLTGSTVTGTVHVGDAVAVAAYADFLSAYTALAGVTCDTTLTGNLAGLTLAPGVYCVSAASTTTDGTLTLDGPSNGIWIFKIGTSGTGALMGTDFSVVMAGGGQAGNVTWLVAEAATLTDSNFLGTILAGSAITITRGTFDGQALAKAEVTLTGAAVTEPVTSPTPTPAAGPAPVDLRSAGNFAILSKSGITNVPTSAITGDVGTSPITGAAITGLDCAEVTGTIYTVDA